MRKDLNVAIQTEGTDIEITGRMIKIKGPKGILQKAISYPKIKIEKIDNTIRLSSKRATRKEKRMFGTFRALLNNMVLGVKRGFTYKMRICSSHFPMNVNVSGNEVLIKNFLGEKTPRKAKILDGVSVKIDADVIIVNGFNKELVGQTCANIEKSVRITNRDRRLFQDGIYLTETT